MPSLRRPSLAALVTCTLFSSMALYGGAILGRDSDLLCHVVYGRALLREGWLQDDPTVWTVQGAPVLHEWASEVLIALLEAGLGLGVFVWGAAAVPALLSLVLLRRHLHAGFWPALGLALAGYAAMSTSLTARPHLVSWVAFVLALELVRRRASPLGLGLLAAVWTNLHGGVLLLPLVVGCALLQDLLDGRPRRSALGLLAVLVGMQLNPWGPRLWLHLAQFLLGPNPAGDFAPPDLVRTGTVLVYVPIALAAGVTALARAHRRQWGEAALLVALILAGGLAVRNLPFLGLALAVLGLEPATRAVRALGLEASSQRLAREERSCSTIPWVSGALLAGGLALWWVPPAPSGPAVPEGAIAWLRAHPEVARARGYGGYDPSGVLLYAIPSIREVYLHSLNANVPHWERLHEELATLEGVKPGWQELLERRGILWTLVRAQAPLSETLEASDAWERAWGDDQWRIYVREQPDQARQELPRPGELALDRSL